MSRLRIAAAVTTLAVLTASVAAHEAATARVTFEPRIPQVGVPCRIVVVAPETTAIGRLSRRVWLSADMPMHVMRPVDAELRRTDDPNVYAGDIVFTMPGPWRVELRVQEVDETMRAAFEMRVLRHDEAAATGIAEQVLELQDMARPTVLPPELVLGSAVVLTLLLQAIAIIFARRRAPGIIAYPKRPRDRA